MCQQFSHNSRQDEYLEFMYISSATFYVKKIFMRLYSVAQTEKRHIIPFIIMRTWYSITCHFSTKYLHAANDVKFNCSTKQFVAKKTF